MHKSTPLPHDCGKVLDIKWISQTRVNYNCSVCGELIAWSDLNPEDFHLQVGLNIPEMPGSKLKKVYPKFTDAQYHPLNLAMWV